MSDVMLIGVLRMPKEILYGEPSNPFTPMGQLVMRANEAADRIESDETKIQSLERERDQWKMKADQATEFNAMKIDRDQWKSRADGYDQNYNQMLKRIDAVAAERDQWRECAEELHEFRNVDCYCYKFTGGQKCQVCGLLAKFEKLKNP